MVVAIVGAELPVWLIGMLVGPLVACVCAIVFVLARLGLTDINRLLQTESIRPTEQLEQTEFEAEYSRLTAPSEESTDVNA